MTTNPITLDRVIRRSDSMLSSNLDNEVVMMDIQEGNYYGLEEPATRLWELAEQPTSIREICSTLQQEYDIPPQQCELEVLSFLEDLCRRNIVQIG